MDLGVYRLVEGRVVLLLRFLLEVKMISVIIGLKGRIWRRLREEQDEI